MVQVLKEVGPMTEREIQMTCFGYDRNRTWKSNKKYADMLRRGMEKGLIDRQEIGPDFAKALGYDGRSKFIYYVTRKSYMEC